jgi:hypothetical protein
MADMAYADADAAGKCGGRFYGKDGMKSISG